MEYVVVLFIGFVIGAVGVHLWHNIGFESMEIEYKKMIKDLSDFIALAIYQESVKESNYEKVKGMKEIQKMYEFYFEDDIYKKI